MRLKMKYDFWIFHRRKIFSAQTVPSSPNLLIQRSSCSSFTSPHHYSTRYLIHRWLLGTTTWWPTRPRRTVPKDVVWVGGTGWVGSGGRAAVAAAGWPWTPATTSGMACCWTGARDRPGVWPRARGRCCTGTPGWAPWTCTQGRQVRPWTVTRLSSTCWTWNVFEYGIQDEYFAPGGKFMGTL